MKCLFTVLFIAQLVTNVLGQRNYALVIGNSSYTYLEELKNPLNDARGLSTILSSMHFEVDTHLDLSKEDFKNVINTFGQKARYADVVLFYYAGHGIEISGKNYFVPVDALASSSSEIKRTCVSASSVTQYMKLAKSKINIVILDACRDNPFPMLPSEKTEGGLALMDAPAGTIISFATAPGKVAWDGQGKNGVFTAALLEHLPAFDTEIKEVFAKVRSSVVASTNNRQIPWESTSLTSEVVLRPKPELPIQINIIEGDSITYEGSGELHAVSNLPGVSFYWYYQGRKFLNMPTVEVNKTGVYKVKAVSKAGQILLSNPIHVEIKSFVDPKPWIEEGYSVSIVNRGFLHGRSNVRGNYRWLQDDRVVGEGAELEVDFPGTYSFQVETGEGEIATSESIYVRIKTK